MSELIKRDDVQREIQASFDGGAFRWQDGQDLMDRINAIPAASPWHRVEEELPEIGKRVLVYYGGDVQILKRTDSMTYDGKNYWWNEADVLWERVEEGSYWMPIEPPKEDA